MLILNSTTTYEELEFYVSDAHENQTYDSVPDAHENQTSDTASSYLFSQSTFFDDDNHRFDLSYDVPLQALASPADSPLFLSLLGSQNIPPTAADLLSSQHPQPERAEEQLLQEPGETPDELWSAAVGDVPTAGRSEKPLACSFHDCTLSFNRKSELDRHLARHTRPFACTLCTIKPFGDKGGLQRHIRETHGQDITGKPIECYCCPHSSCRRHTRGFPRKWNLAAHLRRVHDASGPSKARQRSAATSGEGSSTQSPRVVSPQDESNGSSTGEIVRIEYSQHPLRQALQDEVERLEMERAGLDEERKRVDGKIVAFLKAIEEL
ncbi:hypothetical protein MMC13_003794 [Lambiella insularis]|nr:hypothetical protein [Lambiella insularis]